MLNPFDNDAFSMVALTQAINLLPNNYGRIRELDLMPYKGVRSRNIVVEERNGVLTLLPTRPVGAPGTKARRGKRTVRSFAIPHIPHDDLIEPSEYDGIRAFGTENELAALARIMNDHQQAMRNKHAITLEHLRMGALKGVILDADGSVIYNLYDEFGITPKTINFQLNQASTKVRTKCLAVSRHIEDNLLGEVMTGVRVLCSEEFFDALIEHEEVKKPFQYHEEASNRLGGDPRKGFTFGGLIFEEYRGRAADADGNVRRFIAPGEAHAFPEGTMSTFQTLFAPADFIETANTIGLELYSKQQPAKFDRGIELHTQSNPLPICYRPGVLVKLKAQ